MSAMLWTTQDLLGATGGRMTHPFAATGVAIDSRTLVPGDLFVALIAERDGHDFVADALARGAAGALVARIPPGLPADAPLLVVNDTLDGLTALGRFARGRFGGRLIGVTGSIGKTTAKEMLRTILAAHGPTHAATASYNDQWGVPLTQARMPPAAAFAVIEIGTNNPGEIAPLARLARPHVALITAIGTAHVGRFGSTAAIAAEKGMIAEGREAGGMAVLPGETVHLAVLCAQAPAHRLFGQARGMDGRLIAAAVDAEGTTVRAEIGGQAVQFRLAAPGLHMAMNAVASLLAATVLGADVQRGAAALEGFRPLGGRGARQRIVLAGGEAILLDESYNSSGEAVRAALAVLALLPATRRIAVLGDMLELGAHAEAEHAALAGPIAAHADLLFACGAQMRTTWAGVPDSRRGAWTADAASLAPLVAAALRPGDAVLVKGSLGMGMRRIVLALTAGERAGVR